VFHVAILAGGPSSEHEVSLATSAEMLSILRSGGHEVRPVLIDRENRWSVGSLEDSFDLSGEPTSCEQALKQLKSHGEVACLGLHGPYGEDGTVQRLLESAGIPYTGSGPVASAVGMDKELSKLAAGKAGARTASHEVLEGARFPAWGIQKGVGYPCFVKPVDAGSSVGVARAEDEAALRAAIPLAQAEDTRGRCMVESLITGNEVTCTVLRHGEELLTFPLVSVQPADAFYDYHAKYNSKDTQYICPAEVRRETQAEIELVSRTLYGLLQLDGVVRMDFIVREEDGQPVFLELNTLPGFTSHSLVPMAAHAAGWSSLQVLESILTNRQALP
jgi:D-alanine-D-alanine ligase